MRAVTLLPSTLQITIDLPTLQKTDWNLEKMNSRITAALADAPALPACVQAITIIFQITHYDEHQVHMHYARASTDHPIHPNDLLTYVEQLYSVCGLI